MKIFRYRLKHYWTMIFLILQVLNKFEQRLLKIIQISTNIRVYKRFITILKIIYNILIKNFIQEQYRQHLMK